MSLFQTSVVKKYLNDLSPELIDRKYKEFQDYFGNPERQENIRNLKEEEYQEGFIRELFVRILGYTLNPEPNYNIVLEKKNVDDSKKADGAILRDSSVIAVIELKSTQTTDLDTVETQAFGYKHHNPKCQYIITSNFEKIRIYIQNAVDHLEFDLFNLSNEEFSILWLCFSKENMLSDLPLKIKEASVLQEENVTKKLYSDYSKFREEIFANIVKNNTEFDKLVLFKKTQKLLDRFLFTLFAEDRNLLPPNSISRIIDRWNLLKQEDAYKPLYDIFKQYFGYMNKGRKGQLPSDDIFSYNGGLFLPDEILDNIKIDDELLYKHTKQLSSYNFETEVNVNILGHIFEHSLGEIENVQAEIAGEVIDKQKTKRKKDGIFYTPKYITKYIVENTVGKLCEEKRTELVIIDEEYAKGRKNRKKEIVKELDNKLTEYRNWLLEITILDPACGSGAFLNQALEFLIQEHKKIDELKAQLLGGSIVFSDIEARILEKNIFGVDLNEESVEIAKLSLWLRTAQKGRKLTTLSNHIKCGNSLIDDPEVVGEKAFNWHKEFPEVFAKGGFDIVIGNPPYVRPHNVADKEKVFLWNKYFVASQKTDLYAFFTEKGTSVLKKNGLLGYIIPKTWMSIHSFYKLRQLLLENYKINQIGILPSKVFEDAIVETAIITLKNSNLFDYINFYDVLLNKIIKKEKQSEILSNSNLNINENIQKTLSDFCILGDISEIIVGIATGNDEKYCRFERLSDLDKRAIRGANIARYNLNYTGEFLWYDTQEMVKDSNLKPKSTLKGSGLLCSPKKPADFEIPEKIVMQRISKRVIAAIDTEQFYAHTSVVIIKPDKTNQFKLRYILAILNSSYINFWLKTNSSNVSINVGTVKNIPIKNLSIEKQYQYDTKVDEIIKWNKELQDIANKFIRTIQRKFNLEELQKSLNNWYLLSYSEFVKELSKKKIKLSLSDEADWENYFLKESKHALEIYNNINLTDKILDQMVYKLYDLTAEEIKIVEESSKN